MFSRSVIWFFFSVPIICGFWLPSYSYSGGGPENVFIVVNKSDPTSKTIANHYCRLRHIPACNVFELDYAGSETQTSVNALRSNILEPIFLELKRRNLEKQIDYIVYSSGFPYAVNFKSDFPGMKLGRDIGTFGSLTGLTYLNSVVRSKSHEYVAPSNHYASYSETPSATAGFRSSYTWRRSRQLSLERGRQYHLSVMLGYTAGRGNTLQEVLHYLRRSALADGTHPTGTVYLLKNDNVRSTTRWQTGAFEHSVKQLQAVGVDAKIASGVLPRNKPDVIGAVIGYANFDWVKSGSVIRPGAIVEHLTSFGGILKSGAGQTPLTEFLRYGAAGSSGTVMEPLALQAKFPHPTIHCHYARGCTLAEAFYQSVTSPYQLLIVGDPLCRPWANIPAVVIDEIKAHQVIQGTVSLTPKTDSYSRAKQFQLFIDGRLVKTCRPGETLDFDSTKLGDGHHEIRVVAIEDSAIESQGRLLIPCNVQNHDRKIACTPSKIDLSENGRFRLTVDAPGAQSIIVFHRRIPLAKMNQERGTMTIDTRNLGTGPIDLTVVARAGKGMNNAWFAPPVKLNITETASQKGTPP